METADGRSRDTIAAHFALASAYKKMMSNIENRELFFCWEKEQTGNPARPPYGWNTIAILFQCIFGIKTCFMLVPKIAELSKKVEELEENENTSGR